MDESLLLGLQQVNVTLATVSLVVIVLSLWKKSRQMTALKVFLAFLLVCVSLLLGNWHLVALWGVIAILNLVVLAA